MAEACRSSSRAVPSYCCSAFIVDGLWKHAAAAAAATTLVRVLMADHDCKTLASGLSGYYNCHSTSIRLVRESGQVGIMTVC